MIIPLRQRFIAPLLFLRSLGHDLPATQTNVFPTIDTRHATAQSRCGRGASASIPPLAEQPDGLCAAPDHRVRGCAAFALASFAKCHRSRAEAWHNVWCREPVPE